MKRVVVPGIVLAALAVIIGAWWLVFHKPQAAPAAQEPSAVPVARASTPIDGSKGPAGVPDPRSGLPPSLPAVTSLVLRDQIRDATDLRALYDQTRDLPDPTGERAYRLAEAIFECSVFVDSPPEELSARLAITKAARESPRRQEVFNFMIERCKGFAGSAAALREITDALHLRAEVAGYPAEIARALRSEARLRDERSDQVATALLENPDADVVHELAQYINLRNRYSPQWRTSEAAIRPIAWGLLECQYGGDCGPRSRPVVMTCIAFGACDLQRVEEAVLVQGAQNAVNMAMQMRDRLQRQIAARDWVAVGFVERVKAP